MSVQTPPAGVAATPPTEVPVTPLGPDPQVEVGSVDDGIIEDARARQQRERRIVGMLVAAAVAAGALIVAFGGGGGGNGAGGNSGGRPPGAGGGGNAAHISANDAVQVVPTTQPDNYWVENGACPLAPASRYLPARSGCVTVRRVYLDGGRKPALVLVYSQLGNRDPDTYPGMPAKLHSEFVAQVAFLKVVFANGASVSTRIRADGQTMAAAAIDAIGRVGSGSATEIFLWVEGTSSGNTDVAYSIQHGRLVPAGVTLDYGGDSGMQDGFDCLPGNPSRVIQRTFVPDSAFTTGWRQETEITYAWHGPKLVRIGMSAAKRRGPEPAGETSVGRGCSTGTE